MGLFRRTRGNEPGAGKPSTLPLVGREAFCMACGERRTFSQCWRRMRHLAQCTECQQTFDPGRVYRDWQPHCPHCDAYVEQPGFDYGTCDTCGSKHEIPEGAKPGLMPNRAQRTEMDKHGKARPDKPQREQ